MSGSRRPRPSRIRDVGPERLAPAGAAAHRDPPLGRDGWAYLGGLAAFADAVTAPSAHFASRLEAHGVFPHVDVIWNGIDDDVLDAALAADTSGARPGRPRFVWLGRMSPEKRLLPFLEAAAPSRASAADVEVIGGGGRSGRRGSSSRRLRPEASVVFAGRLPYAETLRRIGAADAVVQTSIGFETQGMTVFEAASLGTPPVVSDPDIGQELGSGYWPVGDGMIPDDGRRAGRTLRRRRPTSRPERRRRAGPVDRASASGSPRAPRR